MTLVDLHTHSAASDGSLPPEELVKLAKERGLAAIALTDHDTIDGVVEAMTVGAMMGVEVISGVEISAQFTGGTMHILGYYIDCHNGLLDQRLSVLKRARADRNPQIIAKLNALGIPITMEQVTRLSGGGQVGRPHIARALYDGKYVQSIQDAFDIYLRDGSLAYVGKFRFPPSEAIAMIREAWGVPVLAHPFTLGLNSARALKALMEELVDQGLAGIEVYYPEHNPDLEALYLKLSRELGLLITGGSDFHGLNKPEVELGRIPCQAKLTYRLVKALQNYRTKRYGMQKG